MLSSFHDMRYFIVLSRSKSISEAAETLHISHQSLSKYIKNLEQRYQTTFFNRTPHLTLTETGCAMLASLQEIARIEGNLHNQLRELQESPAGTLRLGLPEGRFRIVLPTVLPQLLANYPQVKIEAEAAPAYTLQKKLLKNELDLVLIDKIYSQVPQFRTWSVMEENLYLLVSDNLLKKYFPDMYPDRLQRFQKGADLREFTEMPFVLNHPNAISRKLLDPWLAEHGVQLKSVIELAQLDVHILLTAQDYGASFCWGMYLPSVRIANKLNPYNILHVFPLADISACDQVVLASLRNRYLPSYGKAVCRLIVQSYNGAMDSLK